MYQTQLHYSDKMDKKIEKIQLVVIIKYSPKYISFEM